MSEMSNEELALWGEMQEAERVYEEARNRWHTIHLRDKEIAEQKRIDELVESRLKEREAAHGAKQEGLL